MRKRLFIIPLLSVRSLMIRSLMIRSLMVRSLMVRSLTVLSLLAAVRTNAQTVEQTAPEEARILTLENAWNQAVQQKDAQALKMLLAPDLIYVEYDGTLMNKAEYLASVESPSMHPVRIVNEGLTVHFYGTVVVVNGVCRESGIKKGKSYELRERFTDTWVRRGNKWECVASESTLIPR
jgi:ketosteroid isomerase-like protein